MSSFIQKVVNKKTGEKNRCLCIDDFFAHHIYGYKIIDDLGINDAFKLRVPVISFLALAKEWDWEEGE